jgi:hypothetical protein
MRNWNLLLPVLGGHGVEVAQDSKTLIIAGGASRARTHSRAHSRSAAKRAHTRARAHTRFLRTP